jgi:hypothetical protein
MSDPDIAYAAAVYKCEMWDALYGEPWSGCPECGGAAREVAE